MFKQGFLNGENFEDNGLTHMLKRGFIYNGDPGPSSSIIQGAEVSLNGMSLRGPSPDPLIDKELLINVVGMGLKEVFP